MAKFNIAELKNSAQKISKIQEPQKKIEALIKAFELFSEATDRLENAYESLGKEFKNANVQLEESNEKLQNKVLQLDAITTYLHSILGNISQGILFVDFNGIVTTYNHAAEEILGIDHLDLLFNDFWSYFDDNIFGFSMRKALSEKQAPKLTTVNIRIENDEEKELEISTSFNFESSKLQTKETETFIESVQGIIILIRDLTEMHRLQNLENRSNRMKELGEITSIVAHEIRNPLGGINGFACLLVKDLQDPRLKRMASYIVEATNNLEELLANILTYTRPIKLKLESIDLSAFIRDICQLLIADTSLTSNIRIEVKGCEKELYAPADVQFLKSAILNLALNAIQAMQNGGTLTFALEKTKKEALIQISDTGIGILPKNIEKIFTPFFTTKVKGNGFGLSETQKVILAHFGKIEVVSVVGEGSTFTVRLPLKNYSCP